MEKIDINNRGEKMFNLTVDGGGTSGKVALQDLLTGEIKTGLTVSPCLIKHPNNAKPFFEALTNFIIQNGYDWVDLQKGVLGIASCDTPEDLKWVKTLVSENLLDRISFCGDSELAYDTAYPDGSEGAILLAGTGSIMRTKKNGVLHSEIEIGSKTSAAGPQLVNKVLEMKHPAISAMISSVPFPHLLAPHVVSFAQRGDKICKQACEEIVNRWVEVVQNMDKAFGKFRELYIHGSLISNPYMLNKFVTKLPNVCILKLPIAPELHKLNEIAN